MSVNNLIFELGLVWIEALAFRLSRVTHHCQKTLKPCAVLSHLVMSDSLWPYRPQPSRLLRPWDYPGKNTGVGCYFILQGIFLNKGLNPWFLPGRQILYHRFFPIWEAHDKLQPSDEESLVVKSIECSYQHTRTTLESVRKVTEGHWVSPLWYY